MIMTPGNAAMNIGESLIFAVQITGGNSTAIPTLNTCTSSNAAVATASGEYNNRRFQLNLAQEQAIVDTELKRAQLDMQQMQFISTVLSEIKRAVATVSAQLASSALSIISTSATVGSNHSSSMGYQLGVSYYTNLTAPTS